MRKSNILSFLSCFIICCAANAQNASRVERKLDAVILPKVEMKNLTLAQAVDHLRALSREHDAIESNPEWKGVRIGFEKARSGEPVRFVNLSLENKSLREVLDALCLAANRRFDVFAEGVVLHVLHTSPEGVNNMITRTIWVPRGFLTSVGDGEEGVDDPFAPGREPAKKKTARQVLENTGVTFPEGASVFYDGATSTLIVRNTVGNIELIEAYTAVLGLGPARKSMLRCEIYSIDRKEALDLMKKYEGEPGSRRLLNRVKAVAELVAMPSTAGRSGHRSKTESGRRYEYIAGYEMEDGREVPWTESVLIGTSLEMEIYAEYDQVDLNLALKYSSGELKSKTRTISAPVSGKEVEIETVSLPIAELETSVTAMDGQTVFAGLLEGAESGQKVLMCFVTVSSSYVADGPVVPE